MGLSDLLEKSGFKPEKSTAGDKPIYKGVYKVLFVEGKLNEPNQYGHSYTAKFKVVETLSGMDSRSAFPEFVDFYDVADKATSRKKGMAKLIEGFLSVGIAIDRSSEQAIYDSLDSHKGSAELYVNGYKKKPMKNTGTQEEPNWVDNPDGDDKQAFVFMTAKNAEKEAAKAQKKNEHPL